MYCGLVDAKIRGSDNDLQSLVCKKILPLRDIAGSQNSCAEYVRKSSLAKMDNGDSFTIKNYLIVNCHDITFPLILKSTYVLEFMFDMPLCLQASTNTTTFFAGKESVKILTLNYGIFANLIFSLAVFYFL